MFRNRSFILFLILGGFFITNALVAEFIGVKIFSLERTLGFEPVKMTILGIENLSFSMTAGVILWPVVFIMTDIINEYFGKRGVSFLSYLTVGLIIFAFVMIFTAMKLQPVEWWDKSGVIYESNLSIASMDLAFNKIFGQGLWIIAGSLVAFLIGQILDAVIFQRIKKWTGNSKVWLRATCSTIVSQLIDSYVVLFIAFYIGSNWRLDQIIAIGTVNYFYKIFMALILIPLIYLAHFLIDTYLGQSLAEKMKKEAGI